MHSHWHIFLKCHTTKLHFICYMSKVNEIIGANPTKSTESKGNFLIMQENILCECYI